MKRIGLIVVLPIVLLGALASPTPAEEMWWPPIEGSVRDAEAGRGDRPPLFLLVRDPSEKQDEEDEDEASWSIQRWNVEGNRVTRVLDIPTSHDRPRLERIETGERSALALVLEGSVWVLPWEQIESEGPGTLPEPDFRDSSNERRVLGLDSRSGLIVAAGIGNADFFRFGSDDVLMQARLPTKVDRRRTGLQLDSPPVRALGEGSLFVAGPQSVSNLRLRTVLIDPTAGDVVEHKEAWSLLPGPEKVENSRYEWLDGKPYLLCVTLRADKQGIFEKKKLRIFELRTDRTRAGSQPIFEVLSSARMWQDLGVHLLDATGDGVRDLVLLAPEGLGGNKLIVDVYTGLGENRFDERNLRTVIPELGEYSARIYGRDWTGDSRPDLMVARGGAIQVFAGDTHPKKKSVMAREPTYSFRLGGDGGYVARLEAHDPWIVGYASRDEKSALLVLDPAR